jgi:anti-sigma factor RsiW
MCNKELLLGYLYDELQPSERQTFDEHLASCAECRNEVLELRGTRTHLMSWAPPEPDLGFEVVRGTRAPAALAGPARWWGLSPAWGLAAAAMLTVAVSAAIANVEVRFGGSEGLVVRTGWNRSSGTVQAPAAQAAVPSSDLKRVEARMLDLERQLAARPAAVVAASTAASSNGRMSDAEIARLVRQAVTESEQRQSSELARQILQVSRDTELARRADFDRLLATYRQLGPGVDAAPRQQGALESLRRVSLQR